MEELVKMFAQLGITGAVLVVLIYDVFFLQKKLLDILERNTKAFSELHDVIDRHFKND